MPVKFNNLWFRVILNFENLYSYNVSSTKSRRRKRRKARLVGINFWKSKPSRSIDISLDHLFDHVFSFFPPASPDRNGGEL